MNKLDARGFSCPEPVIMTKRALQQGKPLTVLVDNMTAVNNITRFAKNNGCVVEYKTAGEDFEILLQ